MKKIIKTTEQNWKCPYCGFLNNLHDYTCQKCGAVRKGDEVVKEITTNYRETTTTMDGDQPSNRSITVNSSRQLFLLFTGALLVIVALVFFFTNKSNPISYNNENYTVVAKEWEYTVNIGNFVEEKDLTSYDKPPVGAKNIRAHQVRQPNGWYKTEYIYDYAEWKVVKTETISGGEDIPTYKEYTPAEGEKVMSTSVARYLVTCITPSGKQVFSVSEDKWKSFTIEKTYPSSEFK